MKIRELVLVLLITGLASCTQKQKIPPQKIIVDVHNAFSLNSLLQSNMVIQRDKPFLVKGKTLANLNVTVKVSWNSKTFNTVADTAGNWNITIPATGVNINPQTITAQADGSDAITLTNILIGDVWICSGQSNMEMPVDSVSTIYSGVSNFRAEIAAANYPLIRMLSLVVDAENAPLQNLKYPSTWNVCLPANVGKVSAVAFFFALKLQTTLNVPIGIIISSLGGSACQLWTNDEAIKNDPILSGYYLANGSSSLYNGMINPLINLSVKGFIWYQGGANASDSPLSNYTRLNSALIKGWRIKFNQPELPFYYVQLSPYAADYYSTSPPGGNLKATVIAKMREAQANIRNVADADMATIMDIDEVENAHFHNKKPVGDRLALLALKNTYGLNIECYGPRYSSYLVKGDVVTINFVDGTANGLNTIQNAPLKQCFFVAGTDHIFRQSLAIISGSTILITVSRTTPLPIQAIRFAFTDSAVTNLQNSAGLPAEPFRTDDWNQ